MREEGGMRKGTSAWRQGSSRSSWQRAHALHQDAVASRSKMAQRSAISETVEIFAGIGVQIARKYLFVKPEKKVIAYLSVVAVLSLFASFVPLSDHYYLVQKGNVLNKYGVKLGWFWTCFVVGPFMWYASRAHGKDPQSAITDLSRIVVATGFWYFCTNGFVTFEQMTGHCHGASSSSRSTCSSNGGKWVPGFDISGHCFILIYSILIICEESVSFRQLQTTRRKSTSSELYMVDNYIAIARFFFLLMLVLHVLWDFELLVSVLYYHHLAQKVLGALMAVLCWFITYRVWYPATHLPPMPLHHKPRSL
uniref:FIT family protein n=1 Tax=Ascaris suum TaxID=6253 RepID=F1KYF4_ASCSU